MSAVFWFCFDFAFSFPFFLLVERSKRSSARAEDRKAKALLCSLRRNYPYQVKGFGFLRLSRPRAAPLIIFCGTLVPRRILYHTEIRLSTADTIFCIFRKFAEAREEYLCLNIKSPSRYSLSSSGIFIFLRAVFVTVCFCDKLAYCRGDFIILFSYERSNAPDVVFAAH